LKKNWTCIGTYDQICFCQIELKRGRALSLYEEVFPKRLENNPLVHRKFLKKLEKLLPSSCVPILITDAGFGKNWFKSVIAVGYWMGS